MNVTESRSESQHLENMLARTAGKEPRWLTTDRERAYSRFVEGGWPTTKDEAWRFTNLNALRRLDFQPASPCEASIHPSQLAPYLLQPLAKSLHLVFVNGFLRADLSSLENLPSGARVLPLSQAVNEIPEQIQNRLGAFREADGERFAALNAALFEDGVVVLIADDVSLAQPLQILHVSVPDLLQPRVSHPRNLIVVGRGARVAIAESHFGEGEGLYWSNAVTDLHIGTGAHLTHYFEEYQNEDAFQIATIRAHQERDSRFQSHQLLIGGGLVRGNTRVVLAEPGAEALINGLFLGHHRQHLDQHIFVDHAAPHCASTQLFKGILDDRARGVFSGRIIVRQDAQKTDARQTNRNLLLSEGARIDSQPQLEIYADDVKCAHGATTGHIDTDALFYLQARGVDPKTARDLLVYGFAHEVIERMPLASVRAQAEIFLFKRFSKATFERKPT